MDEAGIETTEPIFELATKCERLFSEHVSRLKNESDLNGAKVIGEYQQKFSAWAAFLGVFAVPDMCLDRRLRNHTEVQDLVLRLLDIMRRNLVHLLEIDHNKSTLDEDIDIPDLDQVSSSPNCVNLESLRGIEGAVDRLNHLGRTIQRSSEAAQATKVGRFVTTIDSTSFEEITRSAVKSFYPGASASLLEQLAQAMTNMYERFHYRRSRQVRLQARPKALSTLGEEPASDSKADTGRASFQLNAPPVMNVIEELPRLVSMTHSEDRSHKSRESKPTSLDSREFSKLFSQQRGGSAGSKTRSILVSQVAYPQPSEESLVCEWCFATLSKDELKGEKWKKHLNEDFKPFICISEKCKGQVNQFATSRAWFSHMLETHGQNWHREIHLPVWWICPLCNSAETSFSRAQDLSEHISKLHDDIFTRPQIRVIVNQSQLRSPRPQDICPLCCLSMRDEQQDGEKPHLGLAQTNLLLKDQIPGKGHKRIKTEAGSSQQIQHSDVHSEGETEEMVSNAGTQSVQNTQRVNIEAIARHVAAHLQVMMLFTLRMMSLDVPYAKEDEKSLSSSTDHDSSRVGLEQQRSEQGTSTFIGISEEQDNDMDFDGPPIEDTIPDSEHIIDWKDIINDTQHFSGTDSFLQEVIRSGAFHYHESTESFTFPTARTSILRPRNQDFVCPEDVFNRIMKQSSEPASCVALVGLGGIGKSQLALEFAYTTAASSPEVWVFWIEADTQYHVEESFRRIAKCIELPAQNLPWVDLYQLVCNWLSDKQNGQWTIILDGADNPDVFYKMHIVSRNIPVLSVPPQPAHLFLPSLTRNGSIIVTTRNKNFAIDLTGDRSNIIEIGPMSMADAITLFREWIDPRLQFTSDMSLATRLVKALGRIPLAITQAALYLNYTKIPLEEDLEILESSEDKKMRLLRYESIDRFRYLLAPTSIFATWQISFDSIRFQRPSAAELLSLISFFDRRGIPKWLLTPFKQDNRTPRANGPSIMGRLELYDSDSDTNNGIDDTLNGDIEMLMNHSFINANMTRDIFEMHGLVQLAVKMSLNDAKLAAIGEQFIQRLAAEFPKSPLSSWSVCQELFAHVREATKYYPRDSALEDWATLLYSGGRYARLQGDYETAKLMSGRVSEARQKIRREEGEDTRILENSSLTALILMDQGLYEEADELFTQIADAFKRMEVEVETARSNALISMNNLASIYRVQGRWKEAEKLLTEVRYRRAEVNEVGPSALATLANLASTYRSQGRYMEAEELQEMVLKSCKTELGEGHPQTLTNMSNLASIYRIRGELEKAEQLQAHAMNIRSMKFGKEHPDTLASMNSLASIFRAQGQLLEAKELQEQVLDFRSKKLGLRHPNTLASMNNLALIYKDQGEGEKARDLQEVVVEWCKEKFGAYHPHTLTSMNNLALIWKSQGQHEEAMGLMKLCSEYRQKTIGQEHPYTVSSMAAVRRWSE
ncbi:hypothetical protein FP744_10005040 [Trichoderma asperellum]|nr:hypothetical protein LI328DRAFT_166655 [Trichoderma asperelloides]